MSKHTPAPWSAVEIGQGGPHDNPMPIYEIHAGGRSVVAEFVDENNARLIAAAPQLLDVACRAYEFLADIRHDWQGRHTVGGQSLLSALRDCIAAATGQEPEAVQDNAQRIKAKEQA